MSDQSRASMDEPQATGVAIVRSFASGKVGISHLHPDDLMSRISIIRTGLPVKVVEIMSVDMDVSKRSICDLLGVTRTTVSRRVRDRKPLSTAATERAVFIAGLVKLVEDMVPETIVANGFDAAKWVAGWLDQPQPGLTGKAPRYFLDTAEGRSVVRRLLGSMGSGAYN